MGTAPKTYVPKSKSVTGASVSKSQLSRTYLSAIKESSTSKTPVSFTGTRQMLKAVREESRPSVSVSERSRAIAIEDLSAMKLFKVGNKANQKGIECLVTDYEAKIAELTARAEASEARADREFRRAESTQVQLDDALVRVFRAEERANELSDIPVKEVLQFIIKNSNTAQKKMGEEVRPM